MLGMEISIAIKLSTKLHTQSQVSEKRKRDTFVMCIIQLFTEVKHYSDFEYMLNICIQQCIRMKQFDWFLSVRD